MFTVCIFVEVNLGGCGVPVTSISRQRTQVWGPSGLRSSAQPPHCSPSTASAPPGPQLSVGGSVEEVDLVQGKANFDPEARNTHVG